jgi:hypothetical protein
MSLGAPELLVIVAPLILVGIAFSIWVIVDVRRYPLDAFERSGVHRMAWIAAPSVAIVACVLFNVVGTAASLIVALIWRTAIRPQVATA